MEKIRVIVYEDHDEIRESLSSLIKGTFELELLNAYSNCAHAEFEMEKHHPDVVLMDIDMPEVNGIDGLQITKQKFPDIKVMMLTSYDDDDKIFQCFCLGADGYLMKGISSSKLIESIIKVQQGEKPMTPAIAKKVLETFKRFPPKQKDSYELTSREKEILTHLSKGYSFKMISTALFISLDTVRSHIKSIYSKLQVHSNIEAVAKALREGLV